MPDDDTANDSQADSPQARRAGGRQYIEELVRELEQVTPAFLCDEDSFPPGLELRLAPAQFRSIVAISKRLLEVEWSRIPSRLAEDTQQALTRLLEVVRAILAFPQGAEEDPTAGAENLRDDMARLQAFFNHEVEPVVADAQHDSTSSSERDSAAQTVEVAQIREALATARDELADLKTRNAEISAELDARDGLVEARRDETGSSGAAELARAYSEQAERHTRQWWYWGGGLLATLALAVGFGLLLLLEINKLPSDPNPGEIASHVALDVLVVGLLIYMVRITSHQFSVHRHLAAVADSKAAALSTFSRIVSAGSEPEVRTAIAGILAQSVFSADHTGFISSTHDQITLVERLAGSVSQRAASNADR